MLTAINVKGLRTYAHHGLFEEERILGQKFVFDVTAQLREVATHRDDRLQTSVRYDAVVEEIVGIAGAGRFQTLEALGEAVAIGLLARFDLMETIVVGVSKLSPPIPQTLDQVRCGDSFGTDGNDTNVRSF